MARPWVLLSLVSDQQEYQRAQAADALAAGGRCGLEVRLACSNLDPAVQIRQLSEAVEAPPEDRPAALVVEAASSAGFERAARAAVQAGVGWVQVTDRPRYLERLRREHPGRLAAAACVDNQEIGRLQARLARALAPRGGRILAVEGPSASPGAVQRRRGLEQGLLGSGLSVSRTVNADWTTAGAARAVDLWLRLFGRGAERPDLVVASNDEMAAGALEALREVRPRWAPVPAVGSDGLPEGGQRLVRAGVLAATVVTPPTAGAGLALVARALAGEPVPGEILVAVRPFPGVEELVPPA